MSKCALFSNMVPNEALRTVLLAVILSELEQEEKERRLRRTRNRRWWVRNIHRRNLEQGDYVNLVQELRDDEEQF